MSDGKTLRGKILSDYEFCKTENAEKFSRKASELVDKKLKEFGIIDVKVNFNGKVTATNSTLVALFDIDGEDITFGVSESMGIMALFVVLRCKKCGLEDWEFVFTKDELGYALSDFDNTHKCITLAERIAQDIDIHAGGDDFPQELQDLLGCDGNCEECDERKRE